MSPALADTAGDGKKIYSKCRACHSMDPGRHRAGPSLSGIYGAKAGSAEGFSFSPAIEKSGISWNDKNLDAFLTNPRKMLPGTRMYFPGLRKEKDRKALIAYLKKVGGAKDVTPEVAIARPPSSNGNGDNPDLYTSNISFTLKTTIADGRLVYVGVGGNIEGAINPDLTVRKNDVVQITIINGEGAEHDFIAPKLNARSEFIIGIGSSTTLVFKAEKIGSFTYYCSVAGHRAAGMEGLVKVIPADRAAVQATVRDIVRDPTDLPPALTSDSPKVHNVTIETVELEGRLADGTT